MLGTCNQNLSCSSFHIITSCSHIYNMVFLFWCSFFPKTNGGPDSAGGSATTTISVGGAPSNMGSSHSHSSLPSSSSSPGPASIPAPSRLPFSSSAHSGLHYSAKSQTHPYHHPSNPHAGKSYAELELAKALLELPGGNQSSSSSTKSVGYHTPSPKPSPGKGKGLMGPKKKLSSSSPGEHEGYYPCNRCGR